MTPWLRDAAERVGWTFVEAAAGVIALSSVIDTTTVQKAALAGAIAAAASVKTLAASRLKKGTPAGTVDL